ncbi:MgtC/SapB family protein [Vagococcus sp. BWB3-3]|uniref:MgtC/SapB family protein n=1 Tax=Vagococcus allomyrinae TaxID=2794353 RepID=A0A940P8E5_9ENTE|nr:MgtC/SapB family protein [Vagococcus allomyrinae]MBP1039985.1 MgtC/SapB family protein [Vagococcus allomyrinae]
MAELVRYTAILIISILAGSLIGVERQWRQKLAGIRTTALVCFGSTLFVKLAMFIQDDSSPTRIAAQVVSGIGFLTGGVIIRDGFTVTGINTAATLWCSAAVGTLIGSDFIYEGLIGAVLIMIVNTLLRDISRRMDSFSDKQIKERLYYVSITCDRESEVMIRTRMIQLMNQLQLNFTKLSFLDVSKRETEVSLIVEGVGVEQALVQLFIEKLSYEEGILAVELLQDEQFKA